MLLKMVIVIVVVVPVLVEDNRIDSLMENYHKYNHTFQVNMSFGVDLKSY